MKKSCGCEGEADMPFGCCGGMWGAGGLRAWAGDMGEDLVFV